MATMRRGMPDAAYSSQIDEDDADSLFGSDDSDIEHPLEDKLQVPQSTINLQDEPVTTGPPPIPGLFVFPKLLPQDTACKPLDLNRTP